MTIVAVIVAALLGSAIFPFRRYRFWWKWSHPVFGLSLVVILAINGAIGLLGALIAREAGWVPWGGDLENGASYALLGLGLVRVGLPGVDVGERESSFYLFRTIMRWTVSFLDDVADNKIRTTLSKLNDLQLRELVSYILNAEVRNDTTLDSQDRAAELDRMANADTRLLAGDRAAWAEMLAWCVLQTRTRLLVIDKL